jgi:hypothetical protein
MIPNHIVGIVLSRSPLMVVFVHEPAPDFRLADIRSVGLVAAWSNHKPSSGSIDVVLSKPFLVGELVFCLRSFEQISAIVGYAWFVWGRCPLLWTAEIKKCWPHFT